MLQQVQAVLNLWSPEISVIKAKQHTGQHQMRIVCVLFPFLLPPLRMFFYWGFFRTLSLCVENMSMEIVTGNV